VESKVEETRVTGIRTHSLIETSAERAQSDKIYKWLSPPDPSTNYNRAKDQRHDGTGRWFTEGQTFRSFKKGKAPFLWLNGIPGCGKTVLSFSVIEDLRQESSNAPAVTIYFFFDFNDDRKQTLENAIRSLLWQIAKCTGGSSRELEQLYDSCGNGRDQPSVQTLVQTVNKALHEVKHIRIVLDALDECKTRPALLSWLTQLARQETSNVQIIATSRKEHDIEIEFEQWLEKSAIVPLQQPDVDADIGAYVNAKLRAADSKLQRWRGNPEVQYEIEENLIGKAKGM
jgi:hypothetical protein